MHRKQYGSTREKQIDFVIGFVVWFVINGILWAFVGADNLSIEAGGALNLFVFPCNAVLTLLLLIFRRWFGIGFVGALALNLAISLLIGAFLNGTCAVPFFFPGFSQ